MEMRLHMINQPCINRKYKIGEYFFSGIIVDINKEKRIIYIKKQLREELRCEKIPYTIS
jgi:hypothetical protein